MLDFLIHSPLEHHARVSPDSPALSCDGRETTYAELDAAANQVAHALLQSGLEPGDRVGIWLHKGLDLGPAIYGSLKAGGVFVPLDPFLPPERLAFILGDCEIRHLVTSDALVNRLAAVPGPFRPRVFGPSAEFATSWDAMRANPTTPPDVRLIDLDLGYIMYTSGSTGEPKGMMHTHHGSVSYARWGALHVGLNPADRVASHAPLHFDLSVFDFFSTAQAGGTVVLVPEPVTKFPASWTQYVQDERISVVFTVPYTLVEMLERGAMDERDLSSLRWVLFGGEPFPPKHLRALMSALPDARFTNVYGPAEAPSCTCYDVPVDFPEPVPIGTVSANSEDLVIDEEGLECGIDEEGELCIRSSTLTRGYWNRPDLNEGAFLRRESEGPFPHVFYRTGDVVVRRDDGLLHFLGRRDRMIKTRGHRVELDEVELALAAVEGVREAAVFAVPDGRGSREIRAAVTLSGDSEVDVSGFRRLLRHRLPTYALPSAISVVESLPRTSSGKVSYRRLAEAESGPES
jgi:amino acid adenylation domain-containing protein